jgi:hypothetical protein
MRTSHANSRLPQIGALMTAVFLAACTGGPVGANLPSVVAPSALASVGAIAPMPATEARWHPHRPQP